MNKKEKEHTNSAHDEEKADLEKRLLLLQINSIQLDVNKKKKGVVYEHLPTIISIAISFLALLISLYWSKNKDEVKLQYENAVLQNQKYLVEKEIDTLDTKKGKLNDSIISLISEKINLSNKIFESNQDLFQIKSQVNLLRIQKNELANNLELETKNKEYAIYDLAINSAIQYPSPIYTHYQTIKKGASLWKYSPKIKEDILTKFVKVDNNLLLNAFGLMVLSDCYHDKNATKAWIDLIPLIVHHYKIGNTVFPYEFIQIYNIYSQTIFNKIQIINLTLNELTQDSVTNTRVNEILCLPSILLEDASTLNSTPDSTLIKLLSNLLTTIEIQRKSKVPTINISLLYENLLNVFPQTITALTMYDLYSTRYLQDSTRLEELQIIYRISTKCHSQMCDTKVNELYNKVHLSETMRTLSDSSFFAKADKYMDEWSSDAQKWLDCNLEYFKKHPSELKQKIIDNEF